MDEQAYRGAMPGMRTLDQRAIQSMPTLQNAFAMADNAERPIAITCRKFLLQSSNQRGACTRLLKRRDVFGTSRSREHRRAEGDDRTRGQRGQARGRARVGQGNVNPAVAKQASGHEEPRFMARRTCSPRLLSRCSSRRQVRDLGAYFGEPISRSGT